MVPPQSGADADSLLPGRMRRRILPWVLLALAAGLLARPAHAIPVFARQTQQNCVACHVGGQYPELTPYGRYFKLTGFTQGVKQITDDGVGFPVAMSVQFGVNHMAKNDADGNPAAAAGTPIDSRNGQLAPDQASIYAGGRINDNVGLFAQYTFAWDQGDRRHGTFGADNVDLRYADHFVTAQHDLVFGFSLNNDPGVTDVFNSSPAWAFPFQYSASGSGTAPPVQTALEGRYGGGTARGINAYLYFDRSYYAEVGDYMASSGLLNLLTYTTDPNAPAHNGSVPLVGGNPYFRLAYTAAWGANNVMVGAFGMRSHVGDGSGSGLATSYNDRGLDAQYQYISDPHVVSAQLRYTHEQISDPANLVYANSSANLRSFYAKAMYVYRAKYGAGLAYWSEQGSSDAHYADPTAGANVFSCVDAPACTTGSPNTQVWIPAIFWQPLQNLRLTVYRTFFTQFMGAGSNYDGYGRKASDNNSTYLYVWMDF
jgi:hypothetical protein